MSVREIQVTNDADFAAWCGVQSAAWSADDPSGPQWSATELRVRYQSNDAGDVTLWLADDRGQPVGAAALSLPTRDNLHLAKLEVLVHPQARRRGVGSALLDVAEAAAHDRGRSSLLAYLSAANGMTETPGTRFAETHEFLHRNTEIRRVQRPPFPFDDIERAVKLAEPHASGYEIVTWRDRVPDELVGEYARLESRLTADAPTGELAIDTEVWDTDRVRSAERRAAQMRRAVWGTAAMAPDGSMGGVTMIAVPLDSGADAFQSTTVVDPAHRGRRLGLLLKAMNFAAVHDARPGVQQIWTWNAESNTHMININEIMGYQVQGWEKIYQRAVVSD